MMMMMSREFKFERRTENLTRQSPEEVGGYYDTK